MGDSITLSCRCGWKNVFDRGQSGIAINCPQCGRDFLITEDPALFANRNVGGDEFSFEDASFTAGDEPASAGGGASPHALPPKKPSRGPLSSRRPGGIARAHGAAPVTRGAAARAAPSQSVARHHPGRGAGPRAKRGAATAAEGGRGAGRSNANLGLWFGAAVMAIMLIVAAVLFVRGNSAERQREASALAESIASSAMRGMAGEDGGDAERLRALVLELTDLRDKYPGLEHHFQDENMGESTYVANYSLKAKGVKGSLRISLIERNKLWTLKDFTIVPPRKP